MRELKAKYELFLHARMYASAQVIYLQIEKAKQ
jgi:hypothetical protein